MKVFHLVRHEDVSGVSGTGIVASGVEFDDGRVALRWCVGEHRSTSLWDSIEDAKAIHGHDGRTQVEVVGNLDPEALRQQETVAQIDHANDTDIGRLLRVAIQEGFVDPEKEDLWEVRAALQDLIQKYIEFRPTCQAFLVVDGKTYGCELDPDHGGRSAHSNEAIGAVWS